MIRIPLRRAALAVVFSAAACGSESGTDPVIAAIAGRYALQTIDGQPLPRALGQQLVLGASLTLTDDRRVILLGRLLPLVDQSGPAPPPVFEQGVSETGTYTLSGSDLEFHPAPVGGLIFLNLAHGVVNDRSTITVRANTGSAWHTFVYERDGP